MLRGEWEILRFVGFRRYGNGARLGNRGFGQFIRLGMLEALILDGQSPLIYGGAQLLVTGHTLISTFLSEPIVAQIQILMVNQYSPTEV